jgi:uncharacterized membrane protein
VEIRSLPLTVILLATGASAHFLPRMMRPGLFFGVTVDPQFPFSEQGRLLLRQYRIGVWCSTAVSTAASLLDIRPLFVLLLFAAGVVSSFLPAYWSARRHRVAPPTAVETDTAAAPELVPGGVVALVLPFVLLACLGIWALSPWHPLTGSLVTHWSANGSDHWVKATPGAVIFRLAFSAFWCLIFVAMALGVLKASRRISPAGSAAPGERRFRRRVVQFTVVCEYFIAVLALLNVTQMPGFVVLGISVGFAAVLVTFAISLMRMGQGGNRLASPGTMQVGDRSRAACWKWGLVYFNRSDPAILVESRTGVGYTLNFGNVWSWVLLGLIVAFPKVMHYFVRG